MKLFKNLFSHMGENKLLHFQKVLKSINLKEMSINQITIQQCISPECEW